MRAVEDYHVDRLEVQVRISKGTQLTSTNSPTGLIVMRVDSAIVALPRSRIRECSLQRTIPGGHTGEVTPVPIPNTAVKLARADDSLYGESRSLPGFF